MPRQVNLRWRDSVGKGHYTGPDGERPRSVLLNGTPWIIEENETDLVVAAYIADDGGTVDLIAIPKKSVVSMEEIE